MSIDPGINHTGYSHYRIDIAGQLKLTGYGAISPGSAAKELDDLERAGLITDGVMAHISRYKPAFVFLERPPNTIYYQGKCSPSMLIARAQNVFKVVGVTYAIFSHIRTKLGLRIIPIEPVKWQERSKAKRGDLAIKDWSLKLANSLISQLTNEIPCLKSDRDENIADAISMGYIAFQAGMAG
jgi:hypothetical protein